VLDRREAKRRNANSEEDSIIMDMTGEYRIVASRDRVWAGLNDPEVLRQCIAGCDEIVKVSDTELSAKVTAKVGPVKASFGGKVTMSDLDPPNGYTITGEGSGGAAGFAKGGAKVALSDEGGGVTLLRYTAQANVGGKLAQIGSRLIDGTARKMADDFFAKFAALMAADAEADAAALTVANADIGLAGAAMAAPSVAPVMPIPQEAVPDVSVPSPPRAAPASAPTSTPIAPKSGGLSPWVWVPGVIIIAAVVLYAFTRH
jgi:carbon monoxide dehydrogenase subunit G